MSIYPISSILYTKNVHGLLTFLWRVYLLISVLVAVIIITFLLVIVVIFINLTVAIITTLCRVFTSLCLTYFVTFILSITCFVILFITIFINLAFYLAFCNFLIFRWCSFTGCLMCRSNTSTSTALLTFTYNLSVIITASGTDRCLRCGLNITAADSWFCFFIIVAYLFGAWHLWIWWLTWLCVGLVNICVVHAILAAMLSASIT